MEKQLDPQHSLRDDVPAAWLRLVDERRWGFAQPTITLIPEFHHQTRRGEPSRVTAVARMELRYPARIQTLVERLKATHADEQAERSAFTELAVALLQQVHDVDHRAASRLVAVSIEANPRLIFEILLIALGGRLGSCEIEAHD